MKFFYLVMIKVDNWLVHPLWDVIDFFFNKDNETLWYSYIFYDYCQWAWKGYINTHLNYGEK
jgi:hypothetical protein